MGNDLVDLTDAEVQPEQLHPRFDERVFFAPERAQIAESPRPNRTRWALWAAKESAYKVASKLDPSARFIPRQFGVEIANKFLYEWQCSREQSRQIDYAVYYRGYRFEVAIICSEHWVHAVAAYCTKDSADSGLIYAGIRPLKSASKGSDSFEVRKLAAEAMGRVLGTGRGDLKVVEEQGAPKLQQNGTDLGVDLSLSHHGRFVAFACSYEA